MTRTVELASKTESVSVIDEAAAIVMAAARAATNRAIRQADGCGCRDCRRAAGRAFLWSTTLLYGSEPAPAE